MSVKALTFALLTLLFLCGCTPVLSQNQLAVDYGSRIRYDTISDFFFNANVSGYRNWYLGVRNIGSYIGGETRVEMLTRYATGAFASMSPAPSGTGQIGADFNFIWNLGDFKPATSRSVYLRSKGAIYFIPGFSIERAVAPTLVEDNATQKIRIRLTADDTFDNIRVNVYLEKSPLVNVSFLTATAKPDPIYVSDNKMEMGWRVDAPQLRVPYTFEIDTFTVAPKDRRIFYKPQIYVGASKKAPIITREYGYRARLTDETLGTITCLCDSYVAWELNRFSTNEVVLKASSGEPALTLRIEKPVYLSIVSQLVEIVAKAMATAGTVVQMRCRIDAGPWLDMDYSNETGRYTWNTLGVRNGPHTITIEAVESNGVQGASSITVVVDNTPPRQMNYWYIQNFALIAVIVAIVLFSLWVSSRVRRKLPT